MSYPALVNEVVLHVAVACATVDAPGVPGVSAVWHDYVQTQTVRALIFGVVRLGSVVHRAHRRFSQSRPFWTAVVKMFSEHLPLVGIDELIATIAVAVCGLVGVESGISVEVSRTEDLV